VLDNAPAGMNGEDKYSAICAMMVCAIYRTPELIKAQEVVRICHAGRCGSASSAERSGAA
jgi:hypothetical protein